jgi:regulator of RNase E activity RraB
MNKEIDDMCTDPIIFVDIENDLKDVERDFSEDPALEAFKAKYEVYFKIYICL